MTDTGQPRPMLRPKPAEPLTGAERFSGAGHDGR